MTTSTWHPLHDPADRIAIGKVGRWQVRQFADSDRRLEYFAKRGFAHVQLWNEIDRVSIVTPSRLTAGTFELYAWVLGRDEATERIRYAAPTWGAIDAALRALGVSAPSHLEIRAIERWFVLPMEATAGRLLRSWWAGGAAH